MKRIVLVLAALFSMGSVAAMPSECLDAGIEAAFRKQDTSLLQHEIAAGLEKPKLTVEQAQLLGLATYRMATILSRQGKKEEISTLLERSTEKITPLWERERKIEVPPILSMLYGFQIGVSPIRGVLLGKRTQEMLEDAESMGAVTPRMHLAEALSRFYRPEFLGGGPSKAASEFKLAIDGFQSAGQRQGICWGREDAMLGLARAKLKMDERPGAFALINAVLATDSENPTAQWLLADLRKTEPKGK